ncbi:hypothetical protein OG866_00175 [Streptomyces sp. NBC_00663]|uniref:hypothetical protein n=1 Tax=Streptomyces sp. NBC_00663 TaxID=2975801 RepID=UPI002E37C1D7|nr:hypothetical protein [Streptomyces sp. NBC_00663]
MNLATAFTRDAVVFRGHTPAGQPLTVQDCERAMSDPMWEQWGRHMPPFFGPDSTVRTVIAFQTALTLLMPRRAEDLARYRQLLEELVQGENAR